MDKNKKIIITTAPFGNGHKMVATTLKNSFINKGYKKVYVIDLFTEAHPIITKKLNYSYIKSYNYSSTYSFLFYGVEKLVDKKIMDVYKSFCYKKLKYIVNTINPNIIINTFPILATDKIKKKLNNNIPIFNIVTDFYIHKLWISKEVDKYYVATNEIKEELVKMNIPVQKTIVTGIPIRKGFEEYKNTSRLYKKYNFDINKKIILINTGAFGVLKGIPNLCRKICENNIVQVAVVCGENNLLKNELSKLNKANLKIFGFIDKIDELYKISACMITKSGGITLSEALAVQIPLILYKPTLGQENENALYFEKKGAAFIANNSKELINYTQILINNSYIATTIKKNMKKLYNKNSCDIIVNDVINNSY